MTKRQTNQPIEKAPDGYHLVDMDFSEEARALDQLSPALRAVLAETGVSINAVGILGAYNRGGRTRFAEQQIIIAIRQADERAAIELGTMPGEFWRGRQIAMRPEKNDTAVPTPARSLRAPSAPRSLRRALRSPGSY
jgi:hypothetical protein